MVTEVDSSQSEAWVKLAGTSAGRQPGTRDNGLADRSNNGKEGIFEGGWVIFPGCVPGDVSRSGTSVVKKEQGQADRQTG